jgi:acyl carrier protein
MPTTVTPDQIETVVTESLVLFGAAPEDITRDATFEALDVDSLDLAELSQILNEKFGVELKSTDVAKIKTVGDAIDLIAERL